MSYKVLSVANSQPVNRNNKSLVLTREGYNKLQLALDLYFPNGYTISGIKKQTNIDRATLSKILDRKLGVVFSRIDHLFSCLGIDLEDADVETPNNTTQPKNPNKTKNISQLLELEDRLRELKDVLFELDYKKQCQVLEDFREINSSIGAFLIQGEENRGQRWLVNRLVQQNFPYAYQTDKLVPIIPPPTEEKDFHIDNFWEELGKKLELRGEKTAKRCVEKALTRWRAGSLIMAFYTDNIYQDIPKIIDDFWKPLAERASYLIEEEEIEFSLLMFLIDSRNRISLSGIEMVDSVNQTNWHPQKLIALPKIENFGTNHDEILYPWCKTYRNLLKCYEESSPVKPVMKKIWDNSKGVPEKTFTEIGKIVFDSDDFLWSKFEQKLQYKL